MYDHSFKLPDHKKEGDFFHINQAIEKFSDLLIQLDEIEDLPDRYIRIKLLAEAFIISLNELEQSVFSSKKYSEKIHKLYEEDMDSEELRHYYLHIYYYKNAFIRIFSILDKLGYFLNDLLELNTEQVKPRFSYYTALRQMYSLKKHSSLQKLLYNIKVDYKEPMKILKKRRNLEIHYINVEMLDDLVKTDDVSTEKVTIENVKNNIYILQQGYKMVCKSLLEVFKYSTFMMQKKMKTKR
ncbi:Cthe_2314 family HEPN domain-containing protein [Chengkuizengella axinellae]|uniref:Cthe_2314 family HEPN domain-containing protein n=1 Tax=Chengkuizengella axinellae TaxID=3064388 RepID=A0ABT9ITZ5_9BACL|nr:Cthe_2314 family HEPN domain-containing protein [Chengkuizengella sp. 2205SS18-9]MDP5272567.1 Cthe_2314 family HEPN domain-containing protein [Chengkuizengella sp. 2205SS18-9]